MSLFQVLITSLCVIDRPDLMASRKDSVAQGKDGKKFWQGKETDEDEEDKDSNEEGTEDEDDYEEGISR